MTPDSNDYLAALLNPLRLSYDYIIVDTNPSLGSLTINALTAADEVIIPIDPELFALTGLQALVDTIKKIKRKLNPSIEIGGILFTKCNKRTNLYRRTYGQVTKAFQSLPIFNCQIPYTVKVGDRIISCRFDSMEYEDMTAKQIYTLLKEKLSPAGKTYLFLDEVQEIKGWYDLKKQRRPPLPAVYPKNQAAAERIFAFIEILKDVMKRKGYQERRKPIAK